MTLLLTARFEYNHKPDPPLSQYVKNNTRLFGGKKDRGPALLLIIIYIYMSEINMYTTRAGSSSVVRPKLSYVPWPMGLLLRFTRIFMLPNVNEVI